MTQIGDDEFTQQREPVSGTAIKNAWVQTTEDLSALEQQRQENGWDTVAIPALQTAAVSRDAGKKHDDRYGLFFVIADNHADSFTNAFERGEFPRYEAYRNEVDGAVFLVVELLDPESETAILLAGQYERRHVPGMVAAANEEGELYTHVRTLDKTVLGSFKHEEYAPLVP
ncbi:DUF7529 family protein [Natrialba aegyptia]|uniref:Uncharacterized protein n=1 Tax=Natrialba aegyptia DSM 13077 TaxID=1227491 RepID=M0B8U4_9EURY|nr:hypothetical protein [Natrialba aegyptia]ELZ07235.1 hypothetical protein C480_04246 [Natrialba aegyptia DSM 13077]